MDTMDNKIKILAALITVVLIVSGTCMITSTAYGEAPEGISESNTNYIEVSGVKGAENKKYASFEELYTELHVAMGKALDKDYDPNNEGSTVDDKIFVQKPTTKDKFINFFTNTTTSDDKVSIEATITYTIHGTITYDPSISTGGYLLELGRQSSHFSGELHLNHFVIKGFDSNSKLILKSDIVMPYEWWGEDVRSSIEISDLELVADNANNRISIGQSQCEGINITFERVTFTESVLYEYVNYGYNLTITECKFNAGSKTLNYPLHAQGHSGYESSESGEMTYNSKFAASISITNTEFEGYKRGLNIDQATAMLNVSGCTFRNTDPGRSSIQLSQFMSATITGNTLYVTGNAFTLHDNMKNPVAIADANSMTVSLTIDDNKILDAGETGDAYLFFTDVNGTTLTDEMIGKIDITISNSFIDGTITLEMGIKDGTTYPVSPSILSKYACKVDYNYGSHGDNTSEYILKGTSPNQPSDPSAEGFLFSGWYMEPELTNAFDFNTAISTDTTLYAKWTELFTVTFDPNGHGNAPSPQVVASGSIATAPSNPVASNYRFGGWYTDPTCTLAYDFSAPVTSNLTLYAKWTYVPPTPSHSHNWGAGTITKEPTCTESGKRTYTCSGCGQTRTESIPATGHSWDAGTVTKEPTETEEGIKTYTCIKCAEKRTESIPKLDHVHVWNAGTVTKEPTCGTPGERTYTCTKCNEAKIETMPATNNHLWDSGKVIKEPTETESGLVLYSCTVCGQSKTSTIEPKEIHKEESGGVTTTTESQKETEISEDGTHTTTETKTVTKEKNGKIVEKIETITSIKESEDMTIITESVTTDKEGERSETVSVVIESKDGNVKTESTTSNGEQATISSTISGVVSDNTIETAVRQTEEAERAIGETPESVSKQVIIEEDNVTLSPSSMGLLSESGVSITIIGTVGDVSLDHQVSGNLLNRGENITISITERTTGLSPAQKETAGDSRVIELSARSPTEDIHVLGGTATVVIDMTGMDYDRPAVYWLKDDGTSERINAVFGDGWAQIELSHFSLYYVAEDISNPDDDNTLLYACAIIIVVLIVAICAYVLYRKKTV